jgi:hypothetical protein
LPGRRLWPCDSSAIQVGRQIWYVVVAEGADRNKADRPIRICCDLHVFGEAGQALTRRSMIIAGTLNLNAAFEGQTG